MTSAFTAIMYKLLLWFISFTALFGATLPGKEPALTTLNAPLKNLILSKILSSAKKSVILNRE